MRSDFSREVVEDLRSSGRFKLLNISRQCRHASTEEDVGCGKRDEHQAKKPPAKRLPKPGLPQLEGDRRCHRDQHERQNSFQSFHTSRRLICRQDAGSTLQLLHADALELLRDDPRDWSGWKLVSNLPYSVASPILVELALSAKRPERLVATLQLEVARRLMAQAGDADYGVLTLLIQLDYELRDWFKIPPSCFFPAPDVDSACVVLVRRTQPLLAEEHRQAFVKIVKRAFSQRRKMMFKLLKADWPHVKLERAFAELTISPQERAEKLGLEQFVDLTGRLAA